MTPSMSRKGNCYDDVSMEKFWGTLKNELMHHRGYERGEQARREITASIERFYNRHWCNSSAGELLSGSICPTVDPSAASGMRLQPMVSTIDDRGRTLSAVVMDLYSHRIFSWSSKPALVHDLMLDALLMAMR